MALFADANLGIECHNRIGSTSVVVQLKIAGRLQSSLNIPSLGARKLTSKL